ncbi:MAG: hypothetical protein KC563_08605 [Nitrospira sp.]|nr:hypothetical protein [Nitrospira sp.]
MPIDLRLTVLSWLNVHVEFPGSKKMTKETSLSLTKGPRQVLFEWIGA